MINLSLENGIWYDLTDGEWTAVVNIYQVLQEHNPGFYNLDAIIKVYQALRDLAKCNPDIIAQFLTGE